MDSKLSIKEKIGFSLGDAAANFIFQTLMLLQFNFYTKGFGISAAAAGVLFLVGRLFGAVADPVMGVIADRTNTRWGKFRPWILWTAVPFGIIGYFAFVTPDFSAVAKIIYGYVTYLLLMAVYSANNIPYSALGGVITGDQKQRASLFSFRFVFVVLATIAIAGFAKPMVDILGKGNAAKGYQITMGIFCALATLFFLFTYLTTKERIKPDPKQESSLKEDFTALLQNGPWVLMFCVFLMMFIFLSIRNQTLISFFEDYMDKARLASWVQNINKGSFGILEFMKLTGKNVGVDSSAYGITNIIGQLSVIPGIILSNKLAVKYGKRNIFAIGLAFALLFSALFMVAPPDGINLVMILTILFNFSWGITMMLPWAMMADVADYSEWKLKKRTTAIVFAGIIFGLKVGMAIGGFIGSFILSAYGYIVKTEANPLVIQSDHTIFGIRLTTSIFPAIALFFVVILLLFYKISQKTEIQMQDELAERRKAYQA
jgi:glycoside/pentoside/hexuronide:cation symporter, GPH family